MSPMACIVATALVYLPDLNCYCGGGTPAMCVERR